MTHNARAPKFGDWDDGDQDVPYTAYFDSARKGRKGEKMVNPNDPEENPDMFRNIASHAQDPPPEVPIVRGVIRPAHERRGSREDGDVRQFIGSPALNDNTSRRASGDSAHQRNGGRGSGSGRPIRQSGSEHNTERSPLHPHYQAKVVGKGSASLGLEVKNSFDSSHGTPGRSRIKPGGRGDETPDRGAAVPKFGEWDEKNPSSADGYTHIFNKVREERHIEAGKSPTMGNERFNTPTQKQKNGDDDMKGCCFPWGRK